jgi:hypothetical protein
MVRNKNTRVDYILIPATSTSTVWDVQTMPEIGWEIQGNAGFKLNDHIPIRMLMNFGAKRASKPASNFICKEVMRKAMQDPNDSHRKQLLRAVEEEYEQKKMEEGEEDAETILSAGQRWDRLSRIVAKVEQETFLKIPRKWAHN